LLLYHKCQRQGRRPASHLRGFQGAGCGPVLFPPHTALQHVAGWPVVFEARKIRAAGKVKAARYDPPVLKGAVRAGSRLYASGLRIASPQEVENICSCRISQAEGDGMICPHSVAVALEVIHGDPSSHPPAQP
jgi:hypothetical protein